MENAGCVTFNELYVFRSKVTDARYERRAETILHEMAHMWFGDLVTMRWWDDLWLNESFATYISTLCQANATRWTERLDHVRQRREDLGLPPGPAALDPPDLDRRARRADGRGQLRRHHLRQGRERPQAARRLRRHRGVPGRRARVLRRPRLRQHDAGRPAARRSRSHRAATSARGRRSGSRRPASTRSGPSSPSTRPATTRPSSWCRPRRPRSRPRTSCARTGWRSGSTTTPSRRAHDARPHRAARARRRRRAHRGRRADRPAPSPTCCWSTTTTWPTARCAWTSAACAR